MKRITKFVDAMPLSALFPIFAFAASAYAEILTDIPVCGFLYCMAKDDSGNAVKITARQKENGIDTLS